MKDEDKTKEQLINEVKNLRQRVAELKNLETERKSEKEALQENEMQFRALLQSATKAIIPIDSHSNITGWNRGAQFMFGYTKEEVWGKPVSLLIPERYRDTYLRGIERTRLGESHDAKKSVEVLGLRKDGSKFPAEHSYFSWQAREGTFYSTIICDITRRKKVEKVLKEPEACYNTIFENTGTAMVIIEKDEKISLVNTEFEKLSGYSKDELEGKKSLTEFVVKDDLKRTKEYRPLRRVNSKAASRNYEVRFIDRKGNVRDIFMIVAMIPGTRKSLASLLEITEQKRAENQIKISFLEIMEDLKEKEVLLREIHHRVKNNMQIISSLLNLQSGYIEDKKALELFRETQSRIKSMARVHEKLHQSEDLARIDFAEYIRSLTADLLYTYATEPNLIKLKIDVEDVLLSIDAAIPCGLLINELVSNSLKHAFPDKRKGELCIALRPDDDKLTLSISDNGVGFPDDLDFRNTETLGMQVVNSLVKQINGTIDLDRTCGTKFKITFKELEYKKRA